MNTATMKSADQAQAAREVAHNKLRWTIDQAAREYERETGQAVTRMEIYRKGADWKLDLMTINAVAVQDGKVFT